MFVIFTIDVGVAMSKLIVREKLRDLYKNRLTTEEMLEIKDAYSSLYGLFIEHHPFAPIFITKYAEGYSIEELSESYDTSTTEIMETLRYCYSLFGEVLQLDDASVVRKIDKALRPTAQSLLSKMYVEFQEVE